jgi:hypothetical protein
MTEAEMLQDAYSSSVKAVYAAFSEALIQADGDDGKRDEADARFRQGLIHAKKVKGRALTILAGL